MIFHAPVIIVSVTVVVSSLLEHTVHKKPPPPPVIPSVELRGTGNQSNDVIIQLNQREVINSLDDARKHGQQIWNIYLMYLAAKRD